MRERDDNIRVRAVRGEGEGEGEGSVASSLQYHQCPSDGAVRTHSLLTLGSFHLVLDVLQELVVGECGLHAVVHQPLCEYLPHR